MGSILFWTFWSGMSSAHWLSDAFEKDREFSSVILWSK
jgi:hypothetical protein